MITLKQFIYAIIALIILSGIYMILPKNISQAPTDNPNEAEPVFCTMDAMQCPDGSYVGRTGPNCEFVCPN